MINAKEKHWPCRIEEITQIANFIKTSLSGDIEDFSAKMTEFNEEYLRKFDQLIKNAENAVNSKAIISERRTITVKLYEEFKKLNQLAGIIKSYIHISEKELTVKASDFFITELRQDIQSKNAEGIIKKAKDLVKLLQENLEVLKTYGFGEEYLKNLEEYTDNIYKYNGIQNNKTNEMINNTANNTDIFNDLWDMMRYISDAAKIVVYRNNSAKAEEYNLYTLKRRTNNSRKRKKDPLKSIKDILDIPDASEDEGIVLEENNKE